MDDHILKRNGLLHDFIEEQMTEVKEVGSERKQFFDDLRYRRYWELKEEADGKKRWKHKEEIQIIFISLWTC